MNDIKNFYEYLKQISQELQKKLQPFYKRLEERQAAGMNTYGVATPAEEHFIRELQSINKLIKIGDTSNSLEEIKAHLESSLNPHNEKKFDYELEYQFELLNEFKTLSNNNQIPFYGINKLPDFFSVRNKEQIDYSMEGMEGKKCFCFFNNGFSSNIINGSTRDIRFIWDGFILFTDYNVSVEDLQNEIDLYDSRLVALQRTNLQGQKANSDDVLKYIIGKLNEKGISYEVMPDKKEPIGNYPSKCDLWSTRDESVVIDAINCAGNGDAYFINDTLFEYTISFNESGIKPLVYSHKGAVVLRGENSTVISRLICNNEYLREKLEEIVGEEKVTGYLTGGTLSGTLTENIKHHLK